MKLIVGLGNPGRQYADTRHNAGKLVVERTAGGSFKKEKSLQSSVARVHCGGTEIVLAVPENFMNVSGKSVGLLLDHFGIQPEKDLLIVVDEMALPFGRLRLRPKGSAGGHNGLKSVEGVLGTQLYARLRVGIGAPSPELKEAGEEDAAVRDYVLSRFESGERDQLPQVLEKGVQAVRLWATQPIEAAMNVVNPASEEAD